jgi:hypothetical protein
MLSILFHFLIQRRLTTAAKKAISKLNSRTLSKKVGMASLDRYETTVNLWAVLYYSIIVVA